MVHVDLQLLDEICDEMKQYADTIEKLIARNGCRTVEISGMTEIVFETRRQLTELIGLTGKRWIDAGRTETITDLIERYQCLEGTLKELRNDQWRKAPQLSQAKGPPW